MSDKPVRQRTKPDYSVIEYNTFNIVMASDEWTLVTHYGFYGGRVRSGWMKKRGDGESKTKWFVKIEKAGYYEFSVFIPHSVDFYRLIPNSKGVAMRNVNMIKQYYTVYNDRQEAKATVEVPVVNRGWISLGRFYFTPGESSVILTDKGSGRSDYIRGCREMGFGWG